MNISDFKEELRGYQKQDIVITPHAQLQADLREINIEDVKENVLHPDKLVYIREQSSQNRSEKKFDCYFAIKPNFYHRYILVLDGKLIIVTIIGVNRDWQKDLESIR